MEKAFDKDGLRPIHRLPVARKLGETSLTFLVHPTLSHSDIENTCSVVDLVLREAAKIGMKQAVKYTNMDTTISEGVN